MQGHLFDPRTPDSGAILAGMIMAALVNPINEVRSGSVGAQTWARNRGGLYVRLKGSPTNPNSARQQAVRGFLSTASGLWSTLTDPQRQAWTDWAINNPQTNPLGQSYTLTGHQAFVWHETRVLDQGLVDITDPPTGPVPSALLSVAVTLTSDTAISVVYTPTPLGAPQALFVWQGPPQGLTGDPNFAQATLVGYSAQAAAAPQVFTLPKTVSSGFTSNFWVGVANGEGQAGPTLKDSGTRP